MELEMNEKDREILDAMENQMNVAEVLDHCSKRNYTSIVVIGIKDDQVETAHYTDMGGVIALGLLEMAKQGILKNMRDADGDEG